MTNNNDNRPTGNGKTVLITTIKPISGGVPQMVRFISGCLDEQGFTVRLAYYEPYSLSPSKSVPIKRLFKALFNTKLQPSIEETTFEGLSATGIGCWLPEFEFTNYWCSSHWQKEIDQCDYHLCVSGSNLAAIPLLQSKRPFLAWIATPWFEDRDHRVKQFPWYRRVFDSVFVRPFCRYFERQILNTDSMIALSDYTKDSFNNLSSHSVKRVLHMPVNIDLFVPKKANKTDIKIGFVGRFLDPRKNIFLLLSAFAESAKKDPRLTLELIGDKMSDDIKKFIDQEGLHGRVKVIEHLPNDELFEHVQDLSVFIIPSFQEGLCIAAIEAMSCGVPVISTRCGGPESYIEHGVNGLFVDSTVSSMQAAISQIIEDETALNEYSKSARKTVVEQFSPDINKSKFWQYFVETFTDKN